jgi:DNA repair protein RadA/Sms
LAKRLSRYVCQSCGAASAKWSGRCEACGAWNSIVEEAPRESAPGGLGRGGRASGRRLAFVGLDGQGEQAPRLATGLGELDRVCGGGLVGGSAILIGGDPGIGKSTLLLQAVAALDAGKGGAAAGSAYISGEESVDQIALRARRLGLGGAGVGVAAATSVRDILGSLEGPETPRVVVIDSVQTLYVDSLDSAPGTVAQVRASAQELRDPGRPRHQGGRHRRSQGARAHGRYGSLLRRRKGTSVPDSACGEEPFRSNGRDRRV